MTKPEPLKDKGHYHQDGGELYECDQKEVWFHDDEDIKSAVEWYKEWKVKALSTFLKECPEYKKEWLEFYASRNYGSKDDAYQSFILNKAFEDVMKK